MKTNKLLLRVFAAATFFLAAYAKSAVICDFESLTDLSRWKFSVGSDSVGGTGSLTSVNVNGNMVAQLNYNFTPPSGTAPFNPHYVQAAYAPVLDDTANAVALTFAANAALPRVRLVDATGQSFQYAFTPVAALESTDSTVMVRVILKFGQTSTFWGGAGDGIFHPPCKLLTVLAEASGRRGTGWVRFDQVELLNYQPAQMVFDDLRKSLVVPTNPFGTLSERLGVSIHFFQDNRALDIIQSAGFKWIRMDLKWELAEKTNGVFDFSFFRPLVDAAKARGIRTLGIFAYGNALHTFTRLTPPTKADSLQAFANYASAAVESFQDTNTCFEVWNEPDLAMFWGATPNAAQYATLFNTTAAKIQGNGFKPVLITAGLTAPSTEVRAYLKQFEASPAVAKASGLGMHLYTQFPPESRWDDILELSSAAAGYGTGGKLWCTEWGYSTTSLDPAKNGHSAASRRKQAVYTARMLLIGWLADLPLLNLYDIRDDGSDQTDPQHNFGLLNQDYSDKPAMTAIRTLTGLAAARQLVGTIDPSAMPQGMHAAKLEGTSDEIWIVWMDDRTVVPTLTLLLPADYQRVTDLFGRDLATTSTAGGATVTVSADAGPIYLNLPPHPTKPPTSVKIQKKIY